MASNDSGKIFEIKKNLQKKMLEILSKNTQVKKKKHMCMKKCTHAKQRKSCEIMDEKKMNAKKKMHKENKKSN